ncbi:hypothetical protein TFLX_00927 [Thermoflexales bacterium]|nr:hypothetical protein TFLX_00927 [Thermoflexales bacterium]
MKGILPIYRLDSRHESIILQLKALLMLDDNFL